MGDRHGSRVWHSKGRHWYCWYWNLQARPDHEGVTPSYRGGAPADAPAVPHPHRHVRYPRRLLPRHFRPHRQRHEAPAREELLAVRRLLPHGGRSVSRTVRAGGRLRHRNCWRCRAYIHTTTTAQGLTLAGRAFLYAAVQDLCRYGPDSDFRGGLGSLWVSTTSVPFTVDTTHYSCVVSLGPR
jgi:hypothetical protein